LKVRSENQATDLKRITHAATLFMRAADERTAMQSPIGLLLYGMALTAALAGIPAAADIKPRSSSAIGQISMSMHSCAPGQQWSPSGSVKLGIWQPARCVPL
jgi:hypothetical protein